MTKRKLSIAVFVFLVGSCTALRAVAAQESEDAKTTIRNDCAKLSMSNSTCSCVISNAEKIGDDLLMGRMVLELYLLNYGFESVTEFERINDQIEASQFYLRGGQPTDRDVQAFFLESVKKFAVDVRLICGRFALPSKK